MAWHAFRNAAGQRWEMNYTGMRLLANAYCRAKLIRKHHQKTTSKENVGLFFSLPITNIDIKWELVKAQLPLEVRQFECGNRQLWADSLSQDTVDYLAAIRRQTAAWNAEMTHLLQTTTQENYANWSTLDSTLTRSIEGLRLLRDTSFTFVVVAGTALTGGAALTAIGAGSVLKGVADAQDNYKGSLTDTKMYGSAAITTATTFIGAYLPLKLSPAAGSAVSTLAPRLSVKTSAYAAQGILAVGSSLIDAAGDAAKAVVQGQSVQDTLRIAAARFGTSLVTSGLNTALDARVPLDHLPLTAKVTMARLANLVPKTVSSMGADKIVGAVAQSGEAPMRNAPAPQGNPTFCIDNAIAASDRTYIIQNVLRPAT